MSSAPAAPGGEGESRPVVAQAFAAGDVARCLPRKRVAAGALITNAAGDVMLVKPTYRDAWELPGGLAEVGESPRAAARRELLEELGLIVEIGRLLVVDWSAPPSRADDGLMLVYAAGPVDPAGIRLATDELAAWAWCDRRAVRERLLDFKVRRVEAAMAAHASGTFLELEAGYSTAGPAASPVPGVLDSGSL